MGGSGYLLAGVMASGIVETDKQTPRVGRIAAGSAALFGSSSPLYACPRTQLTAGEL